MELGKNDVKGLSRKYYLYDPDHENYEVEKPAILKIVDLDMAKGLDRNAPALLMKEGEYWGKVCVTPEVFGGCLLMFGIGRWRVTCSCGRLMNLLISMVGGCIWFCTDQLVLVLFLVIWAICTRQSL